VVWLALAMTLAALLLWWWTRPQDRGDVATATASERIEVGHVDKVTTKDYALFQEVEVKPIADFSNLTHVLVVLAKPPGADPDAGQRRSAERAFGVFPY
jgi:hypothetical protein